jgi:hypothetical protein
MAIEEIRNYGNVPNGLANLEKVVLAKRYRIPYWLIEGYITLVENWSTNRWPLETLGSNLGWETTSRILALAVKAREPPPNFESPAAPVLNCSVCGNGIPWPINGPNLPHQVHCPNCRGIHFYGTANPIQPAASNQLYGNALKEAVEEAFKEELASMC